MTEAERDRVWITTNDHPRDLMEILEYLTHGRLMGRKWRLFLCGMARRVVAIAGRDSARKVIECAEAVADGEATEEQLAQASSENYQAASVYYTDRSPAVLATNVVQVAALPEHYSQVFEATCFATQDAAGAVPNTDDEYAMQATLLKDIFGNPFRPVAFDPAWRTDTAVALARQMYDARDFAALPILADALQDAGCEHADILSHCRDPHLTHVRGCWVVDLVLGKA